MIKKLFALGTVFALLAIATPAHAVLVDATFNGAVTSGGTVGAPVSGTFSYNTAQLPSTGGLDGYGTSWTGPVSYSFTYADNTLSLPSDISFLTVLYDYQPYPNTFSFNLQTNPYSIVPVNLTLTDPNLIIGPPPPGGSKASNVTDVISFSGIIDGTGSVDGVNFEVNSVDIAPTPLPPSLLMFGTVLAALTGFAWMRKGVGKRLN